CWPQSYRPGERVELRCSSRVDRFAVEVARLGARREVVWRAEGLTAPDRHDPSRGHPPSHDTDCGWPVAAVVPTETSWPSGFYHVQFVPDLAGGEAGRKAAGEAGGKGAGETADAFFVVRPRPGRPSGTLLALSTNTWNAYNQWGGRCLYSGATRVSFARPLERGYLHRQPEPGAGDGFDGRVASVADRPDPDHRRLQLYQGAGPWPLWTGSAGWHNWERRFVAWAERRGHTIDVAVNADLEFHSEVLDGQRLLLSVGHDEYWSWGMRDTVDSWVEAGGNWAIFSGNTMFWQVRFEDNGRTMVCYKGRARTDDPEREKKPNRLTSIWSDPLIGRPETHSTGLTFTRGGYHRMGQALADGPGTYTVVDPDHWVLAGTGLAEGDEIGAGTFIVAYEVDGCATISGADGRPVATGEDGAPMNLEIIATAPARLISITDEHCEAPEPLWASVDPPGDLEFVSEILFGSADHKARLSSNQAVMASFRRGRGTVFNAGTTDWSYGLTSPEAADAGRPDTAVDTITANVIHRLSTTPGGHQLR
ncbi:MAG: hypothetical protein OER95_02190, partial [Acidimicrobiia bacterium]|nr:hypothetical protein [Acidimicrobiia bacterium]